MHFNLVSIFQLIAEFDEDCRKAATASGFPLPGEFSVAQIFEEMTREAFNAPVLQAALALRNHGNCFHGVKAVWEHAWEPPACCHFIHVVLLVEASSNFRHLYKLEFVLHILVESC